MTEKYIKFLEKTVKKGCPRCGYKKFEITQADLLGIPKNERSPIIYPAIAVVCPKCANVQFHFTKKIDQISETRKPKCSTNKPKKPKTTSKNGPKTTI